MYRKQNIDCGSHDLGHTIYILKHSVYCIVSSKLVCIPNIAIQRKSQSKGENPLLERGDVKVATVHL